MLTQWKRQSDRSYRICAFGSSNTELSLANNGRHNWVDWLYIQIRQEIGSHVTITNMGIGGETTVNLLDRIERDVKPLQPSMVIVTIGGNDANTGMPTSQYVDRGKEICTIIREYEATPVLQTYYCPMYHQGAPGFEARFEANMQAKRDLSKEMDIALIDQYAFFEPFYRAYPREYELLMRDMLHLNPLGNLVMAQRAARGLGLPEIPVPEDLWAEYVPLYDKMCATASR